MGAKGECACCKEWKDLTVHHVKEANNAKIMVCFGCHRRIEEYPNIVHFELADPTSVIRSIPP